MSRRRIAVFMIILSVWGGSTVAYAQVLNHDDLVELFADWRAFESP